MTSHFILNLPILDWSQDSRKDGPICRQTRKMARREHRFFDMSLRYNRFLCSRRLAQQLHLSTGTRIWIAQSYDVSLCLAERSATSRRSAIEAASPFGHVFMVTGGIGNWTSYFSLMNLDLTFHLRIGVFIFGDTRVNLMTMVMQLSKIVLVVEVLLWCGVEFCHRGKTELVTVAGNFTSVRYCDEI